MDLSEELPDTPQGEEDAEERGTAMLNTLQGVDNLRSIIHYGPEACFCGGQVCVFWGLLFIR